MAPDKALVADRVLALAVEAGHKPATMSYEHAILPCNLVAWLLLRSAPARSFRL